MFSWYHFFALLLLLVSHVSLVTRGVIMSPPAWDQPVGGTRDALVLYSLIDDDRQSMENMRFFFSEAIVPNDRMGSCCDYMMLIRARHQQVKRPEGKHGAAKI